MDHRKQQQRRRRQCPSPRSGGGGAPSAGKDGGGGGAGIKVVYISNPVRVKTTAAGFRALVQELTGLHAGPSKYSTQQELSPEGSAAGPGAAVAAFAGSEEEEDFFRAQLLDNDYSVFSPPTLLYDYPPHSNKV